MGVNDSARLGRPDGRPVTEFSQFQLQLANLLERAQQLCEVVFVGMVPVDESKMPFMNCFYYNHADQYRYKQATKQACAMRQIPYLDIFDLWLARGMDWVLVRLSSDGLHPNFQGYQALLQDVLDWKSIAKLG